MKSKSVPNWSSSYGFLMTLLFGLMVVLYAQSHSVVPSAKDYAKKSEAKKASADVEAPATSEAGSTSETKSLRTEDRPAPKSKSRTQIETMSAPAQEALDRIAALGAVPNRENSVQGNSPTQERISYEWIGSSASGAKQIRFHVEREGRELYAANSAALDAELEALVFRIGELLAKTRREIVGAKDSRVVIQVSAPTRTLAAARVERVAKLWTGSRILSDEELTLETRVSADSELAWILSLP